MENFFSAVSKIIEPLANCSSTFVIFFVFTIVGLIVGTGLKNSLRNGLLIAAGFTGVNMALNFFLETIAPVAEKLGERFGGHFTYTDIGWPGFSTIAFESPWAYAVIAISILVNVVMLVLNLTDTINLNIWDTWHTTITALVVYALTKNYAATVIAVIASCALALLLTDWFANKGYVSGYFGMSNISYFQGSNAWWAIFAEGCSKLLDKLNISSSGKFTPAKIQEKFGILGEPTVIGGLIGLLMGIAGGLFWTDIVMLMIGLAACLLIMPMMVGIVVQALIPLSEAAGEFTRKISKGKKSLYVGVDVALACGDETVMAVSTIMIPIILVIFLITPGSCFIPLADLGSLCFFICWMVAANKGDLLRTLITAILSAVCAVFLGMITTPLITVVGSEAGYENVTSLFISYDNDVALLGSFAKIGSGAVIAASIAVILVGAFLRLRYVKNRSASEN